MYLIMLVMHTYIYLIVSKYSTGDLIFYISTQYDQFTRTNMLGIRISYFLGVIGLRHLTRSAQNSCRHLMIRLLGIGLFIYLTEMIVRTFENKKKYKNHAYL